MTDDLLETFTRQYIQSQPMGEVQFVWQGGEPTLMGVEFYRKALAIQRKYTETGKRVENVLQTNATLLDDEWCLFLKENNFLVGISIDGPPELHNRYRVDHKCEGTADRVLHGLTLLKNYKVESNILCAVHAGNVDYPIEVYRYLRDKLDCRFIQFIPIVELDSNSNARVTNRSVSSQQYGNFLITIFNEWLRTDVGSIFVQIFDVALGKWMGIAGGLCVFEKTCGRNLALEHNGDLFSCDHFVEFAYRLGNINEVDIGDLVNCDKQSRFGKNKRDSLPNFCSKCEVRFACNGGCPKNRFIFTPDGEYGLNYLCDGYKAFFSHIKEPMRQMAQLIRLERPPADIMKLE